MQEGLVKQEEVFEDKGPNPVRTSFIRNAPWITLSRSKAYDVNCEFPEGFLGTVVIYRLNQPGPDSKKWVNYASYAQGKGEKPLTTKTPNEQPKWLITAWRFTQDEVGKASLAKPITYVDMQRSQSGSGSAARLRFSFRFKDDSGKEIMVILSRPK